MLANCLPKCTIGTVAIPFEAIPFDRVPSPVSLRMNPVGVLGEALDLIAKRVDSKPTLFTRVHDHPLPAITIHPNRLITLAIAIHSGYSKMAMKKVTVAMTDEMVRDLERERKDRRLASVAEAARVIIGEYLADKDELRKK